MPSKKAGYKPGRPGTPLPHHHARPLQNSLLSLTGQHFVRSAARQSGRFAERRYADELARPFARLGLDHIALREDDLTAGRRLRKALHARHKAFAPRVAGWPEDTHRKVALSNKG